MARIRDLDLSFENNPVTGDLSVVTDFSAIRKSLDLILRTGVLERPFREDLGSEVPLTLFDVQSPADVSALKTIIQTTIEREEPRITVQRVEVLLRPNRNRVDITVEYIIRKTSEEDQYSSVINLSE